MRFLLVFISFSLLALAYGNPASEHKESSPVADPEKKVQNQRSERQIYCPPGFTRRWGYITNRYLCVPNNPYQTSCPPGYNGEFSPIENRFFCAPRDDFGGFAGFGGSGSGGFAAAPAQKGG